MAVMFICWLLSVHDSNVREQCCVSSGNHAMSMRQWDDDCSIVVHQKHDPSAVTDACWISTSSIFSLLAFALQTPTAAADIRCSGALIPNYLFIYHIIPISLIFLFVICVPCPRSYCSLCHVNHVLLLLLLLPPISVHSKFHSRSHFERYSFSFKFTHEVEHT